MRCDNLRKTMFILIGILSFILGMLGAFTSIKLFMVGLFCLLILALVLLDYQKATYIVSFYIIIDYIFRQFFKSAFLASYWDEILFVGCMLLWFYKWLVYRKQKPYALSPMDIPLLLFFGVSLFLLIGNIPDYSTILLLLMMLQVRKVYQGVVRFRVCFFISNFRPDISLTLKAFVKQLVIKLS